MSALEMLRAAREADEWGLVMMLNERNKLAIERADTLDVLHAAREAVVTGILFRMTHDARMVIMCANTALPNGADTSMLAMLERAIRMENYTR